MRAAGPAMAQASTQRRVRVAVFRCRGNRRLLGEVLGVVRWLVSWGNQGEVDVFGGDLG